MASMHTAAPALVALDWGTTSLRAWLLDGAGAVLDSVRAPLGLMQVRDGDFQLVVRDNGEGISSEPDRRLDRGHGMATMKQRAKQLQGQCLIESGPGFGTVIRLTLPLERALDLP